MKKEKFLGTRYFIFNTVLKDETLPVLMVHGHSGDHGGLSGVAMKLRSRVVVPDLPGYGESERLDAEHSIEGYVDHLKNLIDHLGYKEYHVVGHSLGGAIALQLAGVDMRIKKVVLMNPVPVIKPDVQNMIRVVNKLGLIMPKKAADYMVNSKAYDLWGFILLSRRRADLKHLKNYLVNQGRHRYDFTTWAESGRSVFFFDHFEAAKSINVPALILHAEKDSMTSLDDMQTFASALESDIEIVPRSGHLMPIENADEAAEIINSFLYKENIYE